MFIPTIRQRRLAAELRKLREECEVTLDEAAEASGKSKSTISRVETAQVGVAAGVVAKLLDRYGVEGNDAEYWLGIAREARRRGWWKRFDDVVPDWFEPALSFETDASVIREFEIRCVPGLLQTEAYARAIMRSHPTPPTEEEIDRQVEFRMGRQKILAGGDPPQYFVVLDEAVLRRVVGSAAIMRDQLRSLQRASDLPNVAIQVLPAEHGGHAGINGPFLIWEFQEGGEHRIVHIDHMTGALYLDAPREIGRYTLAFEHLRAACLNTRGTRRLLGRVVGERP